MKQLVFLALTMVASMAATAQERPNILLIVADDLGYADVGAFGSDIKTPNIDSLADRGRTFTQFHTAPLCSVTRAMLLSGNNNHVAGVGRQNASGPVRRILPGYEGSLSDRVELLPRLLRDAGYHTYAAGKWHLGMTPEHSPKEAGFERSYMLLNGSANHFRAAGRSEQVPQYREDDDLVDYPEGRYSTELYTDRLIEFIESGRGDGRPFFLAGPCVLSGVVLYLVVHESGPLLVGAALGGEVDRNGVTWTVLSGQAPHAAFSHLPSPGVRQALDERGGNGLPHRGQHVRRNGPCAEMAPAPR